MVILKSCSQREKLGFRFNGKFDTKGEKIMVYAREDG